MLPDRVRKNILDLEYNKYVQHINTCAIAVITYVVGVGIALITKQIDYNDSRHLLAIFFGSLAFISSMILLIKNYKIILKEILEEIKQLKL